MTTSQAEARLQQIIEQAEQLIDRWRQEARDNYGGCGTNSYVEKCADDLAALLREGRALQASTAGDKTNENADTRVDDSQYGAPLATAAENKPVPTKDAAWAVRNCHMLARRELKRLASWRKNGGETTPVGMVETAWEHIQRICELTGYVGDGPLRESSSVSPHPARHEP